MRSFNAAIKSADLDDKDGLIEITIQAPSVVAEDIQKCMDEDKYLWVTPLES